MLYLLVDDDDIFRDRLARALVARQLEVHQARNAVEAVQLAARHQFLRAVVDLRMPGESGLWLLEELRKLSPQIEVLILTGYGSVPAAMEAVRLGAVNFISKPCDADQILAGFESRQSNVRGAPAAAAVPSLEAMEREYISRVMHECEGNVSRAAQILGLHRRSLQRKLKKFPN
ncbi:MAG: response regulator [Oligoflexia bacterium]|nr:response regulator [Oligoflexia bacterium]